MFPVKKLASTSGFTLVELLIYIGIFSVVAGLVLGILNSTIRSNQAEVANNEVTTQLNTVLTDIQNQVNQSSNLEVYPSVTNLASPTSTGSFLKLRMNSSSTDPTCIYLASSTVYMAQGPDPTNASQCNQSSATALTTSQVLANNLTFTQITVPGGHASVSISLQITYNSSNPAFAISKTLQSAIGRVSAATFDDNLLPNADNTFDIGQIAPNLRWRNGNFAGTVTIGTAGGALGIGTETPSGVLDVVASSTNSLVVANNGNVGIGTTNPAGMLEIDNTPGNLWGDLIVRVDNAGGVGGKLSIVNLAGGTGAAAVLAFGVDNSTLFDSNGNNESNAEIRAINTSSSTNATDLRFSTWSGSAENVNLVITAGGNIGIGTISPIAKLTLVANSPATSTNETSGSMFDITTGTNGQSLYMSYDGINNVGFIEASQTGNYEPLILQPRGGDVGIGTITPGSVLEVDNGVANSWSIKTRAPSGADNSSGFWNQSDNSVQMALRNGAGALNTVITSNGSSFINGGNLGIGTTTPQTTLEVNGNAMIDNNIILGTQSNTGGGSWYFGTGAWSGSISGADSVTGLTYANGTGSQLFTLSSAPGQASLQLDGSVFVGDGLGSSPDGLTAASDGYLVVQNNAYVGGNLSVSGTLTATTKNFKITDPLNPNDWLYHSSLEGPEVGVYYRGLAQLKNGVAVVKLPNYFEALTRKADRTVLLTPQFTNINQPVSELAASSVVNGEFTVKAIDNNNPSQAFSWEVQAVRADVPPLQVIKPKS